jgi:hypothetical protein
MLVADTHRAALMERQQGRKPTVKEVALITRETRPAALKEIATSEVLAFQRSQLSPEEWRQLQSLRSQAEVQTMPVRAGQERQALRASISHLFERSSVLREHEVLAEALNQSLGSLDLERLKQAASNGEGGLFRLTDSPQNQLLSECCTRQGLHLEQQAVKYVNDTRNSCPALNSRFVPAAHLSEEQKAAVHNGLTRTTFPSKSNFCLLFELVGAFETSFDRSQRKSNFRQEYNTKKDMAP